MVIEINFPRGGRKPPPNAKPQEGNRDHDLFGRKRKKQIYKHAEKTNIFQEVDDTSKTKTLHVEQLSGKTIQEGMILIGSVKEIQKVALEISLPGRLWGKVFVNSVSKPYTKLLQTVVDGNETEGYIQLNELFTLGQRVAVKVLNLNDEKYGITLSMMPQQVNAHISHTNVKSGMTLWGAISEVEDHGYVVDLGINNCRAFLKKENCHVNKDYSVGELLWFAIIKADVSTATTVTLSAKQEKIRNIKIHDDISLDHLLPGMQLDFTISEVLSNGLEGKFFNDYTGYIDIGQLSKSLHNKNEYVVDNVIQARILYMMPVTKIAYFTLKHLEPHKKQKIIDGTIMTCKIQGVTPFGIYIKLVYMNSRGFVPLHRVQNNMAEYENRSNYSYLKEKYPKHSNQQCRVLNYDYFEQMYICSMENNLINKKIIFSLDNLKAGQTVSAEIKEIQPNGLLVTIQQVTGFIKNEHICDTVLKNYNNVKSRFKVGQTIQARVWVVNKEKHLLYLTMRPSLVNTKLVLKVYQQAKQGEQFLGVIRQITTNGLLVQFFGDVHGWVPKQHMVFDSVETLNLLFKIGQLVKCIVVKRKKEKLTLSLQSSTEITEDIKPELKLGEHVDGIVSHVTNEGVHITVKNSDITAFVPNLYTSKFPKLAPIIAKMYQPGDEISDLVCVSKNDSLPTLSLRDSDLSVDNIQNIKTLKRGTILPCSVSTMDSFGINVEAPIDHFKKTVLVSKENISDDHNVSTSNLKLNQQIYAKVFNVDNNLEVVTASAKLSNVWDYDIQSSVKYLSEYLKDVWRIREYFKSLNNPLACLNLGEIVSGDVRSINNDNSCIVQLENNVRAVVQSEHAKENVSINDKVEGIVLYWNFEDNVAEIALNSKLIPRINQLQNAAINIPAGMTNKSNAHAEVILVKDDFVLGVLRGAAGKRQLIFFPSRLHTNDLKPNLSDYVIGDYINVQVNKIENGIRIGLLKQFVRDMKLKRRNLKYKRESDKSEYQPESKRVKLEISKDKKNKEKINTEPEIDENNTEEENETDIIVNVKQEKKNKESNDGEMLAITETKKNKREMKNKNSNEKIVEEINKNKKERKKKNVELEIDENNTEDFSENETKIIVKVKQEKKNNNGEMLEINKIKKERRKKNSVSSEEENITIAAEENKNKKEKQKKRKMDVETDTSEKETNDNKQTTKKSKQDSIIEDAPAVLPGANNFWNISEEPENVSEESSDDDQPNQKELEKQQKKKKMTPAEKAEKARLEEERIRKIELELADVETNPKTADQFDRLVLANPNNSMLWINYMAFHLEATEIEKARTIARKALNTIEFRDEQDKLNIWIAFLNLENRYGAKESFASVLEEAVKMNDSLTVYLQSLNILSESKKTTELQELLRTVSRKFKQEFKMWTGAAEACYKNDLKEEARDLMQRSLKSLDEKQHINILVQFAFMEARHNDPERAEALLEKVIASYPRRVDVWTSYVDMLIKGNRIHIARNVLERAVGQKLPARKMKTIFRKYMQFETKYGDEDSVKKVRQIAAEYVKTALN